MQHTVVNTLGEIWAFMDSIVEYSMVRDEDKQMTIKLEIKMLEQQLQLHQYIQNCTQNERLRLQGSLGDTALSI